MRPVALPAHLGTVARVTNLFLRLDVAVGFPILSGRFLSELS